MTMQILFYPDAGPPGRRDIIPVNRQPGEDEPTNSANPNVDYHTEQVERVDRSNAGIERHERIISGSEGVEHREEMTHNRAAERQMRLYRSEHLIRFIFGFVEALIGVRVVLHLLGANVENPFAHLVYVLSNLFLFPFFGLIGSPAAGSHVLEIPSLIAIVVYALIAWGLVNLVHAFSIQTTTRTYSSYDRYRN